MSNAFTEKSSYLTDLCRYFENYQDAVMIMDVETMKICYLNRAAKIHFHVKEDFDYRRLHCFELFDERLSRCDDCVHLKHLPEPGQFYNWNSKLREHKSAYHLRDTQIVDNGHRYLLEITQRLDYELEQGNKVLRMSENERLINEAFDLAMNETDPDKAIDLAIAHIGERLGCDRAYIFEENEQGNFDNTYEWCAPGITREKDNLQDCPYSVVQVWYDEFDKRRNVLISDLEAYKSVSEPMYEYLKPQAIKTLVVAPLVLDNRRIGFYGVDNPPVDSIENISTMFEVLGHFLTAMIRHRQNNKKLEKMSFYDQMTGLQNRHGLDEYVDGLDRDKSITYIFCDINGLKKVNDTQGHGAGDELIVHTANVLRKVFRTSNIFRMGGDEFLVILSGVSEDTAKKKTDDLREALQKGSINAAIGMLWRPKVEQSFDELYSQVDSLMYKDKRAFYGERRKRQS